jgi:putative transposase
MLVLEYKIKANKQQQYALNEAIRTAQFIRNKCLRYWMDSPKEAKLNWSAVCRYSTVLRDEFAFVKELGSQACQTSAERAWLAIQRFFDNCKKSKPGKKGYPQFQKNNRSVEYKNAGWKLHPTKRRITFTDKKNIGEVKLLGKWDVHTFPVKAIKRVRLIRKATGYFCQFVLDIEQKNELQPTNKTIGIDVGLNYFYTDSDGYQEPNPRFLRKAHRKIRRWQQRLSKKVKGSNNRKKARQNLAKAHFKVSEQRKEFCKQTALRLIKSNDIIAHEKLNIKGLAKSMLAKSINDVAWGIFLAWLTYFGTKYSKIVIAVDPRYTSQTCSSCGLVAKKSLSQRIHQCVCGCVLDRDENAAIVILNKSTVGRTGSDQAFGVETSTLLGANLAEQVLSVN